MLNGTKMQSLSSEMNAYDQRVGSSRKMDSTAGQLLQSTDARESRQYAVTMVNHRPTSSDQAAATTNWVIKAADNQVSSRPSARYTETADRRVQNDGHPIAAPNAVVQTKTGQRGDVQSVQRTSQTQASEAERGHARPRPAIAVIRLSSRSDDDKVVYRDLQPGDGTRRSREAAGDRTPAAAPPRPKLQSSAPLVGDGPPRSQHSTEAGGSGATLAYDSRDIISRPTDDDSWKRRKAKKLAKRHIAEHQQRYRQL